VEHFAGKLGDPWKLYFDTNAGLPESEQEKFIKRIGLKSEPPANYRLIAYYDFLKKYGLYGSSSVIYWELMPDC